MHRSIQQQRNAEWIKIPFKIIYNCSKVFECIGCLFVSNVLFHLPLPAPISSWYRVVLSIWIDYFLKFHLVRLNDDSV